MWRVVVIGGEVIGCAVTGGATADQAFDVDLRSRPSRPC